MQNHRRRTSCKSNANDQKPSNQHFSCSQFFSVQWNVMLFLAQKSFIFIFLSYCISNFSDLCQMFSFELECIIQWNLKKGTLIDAPIRVTRKRCRIRVENEGKKKCLWKRKQRHNHKKRMNYLESISKIQNEMVTRFDGACKYRVKILLCYLNEHHFV